MAQNFEVSGVIPTTTAKIYAAWLDGDSHAKMTGGAAEGQPVIGARHTAWDGYITGANLELEPPRRIVQSWRTTEFPEEAPDSRLEILLEPVSGGTRVIIRHSNVPDGQGSQYQSGWHDHYLTPMAKHFSETPKAKKPAKTAQAVKPAKAAQAVKPAKAPPAKKAKKAAKVAKKKPAKAPVKPAKKKAKKRSKR